MTDRSISSSVPVTQEQANLILRNMEEFKAIMLQQLHEQARTNELLAALAEALSDGEDYGEDGYVDSPTYLNGSPR
ncbi:hypothetical protein [Pseudomonas panipatensis]|uniref:Uncharacterized protein n=1 Tax=Pseudomonas panipatensis TaxID=428992 RepID=A0A1G8HJW8_9PSED|nr:hypothetical protein [Pseudomonas panipatensis]SDI07007.1 hypothetical protein SAMN05216272_105282 [Pseudomonas panipatensis]SMP58733.1 hypothetical protein SAMN06295951_104283 [Pseudomonas panipatensis]